MANQVEPMLIQPLYEYLQRERFVTVCSIDHETSGPNVSAISWVFAPEENRIVFAIDNRSRFIKNIQFNPQVVVNLIANESTYSIYGTASVKLEKIESVPLKLALIDIQIKEVRDVMFYGSKMVNEPKYEKTYDLQAAAKLDRQVMDVLKNS
ncbi:pyridoxamine 5'-phosphate oxidase family protein [Bacillus timonensis]|nr:pyridoxamine 5'-phosphate oxidase family protein [Bacillus timonensis]